MKDLFGEMTVETVPTLTVYEQDGKKAVLLNGRIAYLLDTVDKTNDRHVAVQLYLTHHIDQGTIAAAWKITRRSLNGWIAKYRENGIKGLAEKQQGPAVKIDQRVRRHVLTLRAKRMSIHEIAAVASISPRSVNQIIAAAKVEHPQFPEMDTGVIDPEERELNDAEQTALEDVTNLKTADPLNRVADRIAAVEGLLDDAVPIFADCEHVEGLGALLAVAMMAGTGFLDSVHRVYRTIGPAFYGLRNTFMMFFMMAVLRIINPEKVDAGNPLQLGRLLGLDRSPSVKTIRRKIWILGQRQQAGNLMNLRSRDIMNGEDFPDAVLLIDGHVQCYYGGKKVGKTFSNSKSKVVKGATDYWVNLPDGTPLLCLPTTFNQRLNEVLPAIVIQAQKICNGRRITVIFDRGGADTSVYQVLQKLGCDFIAYHKNPDPVDLSFFTEKQTRINKRYYDYAPYERTCELAVYKRDKKKGTRKKTKDTVKLREIIVRRKDDGCTHVITTIEDAKACKVCGTLFGRWTQENFFKHMLAAYNLDHLYTYRTEKVPDEVDHPNPEYAKLQRQKKKIRQRIAAILGIQLDNIAENKLEQLTKLHQGKKGDELRMLSTALKNIEHVLKSTPKRESAAEYDMIESETRMIGNLVKMTAWDVEGNLAKLVANASKAKNRNERGIVEAFIQTSGQLKVQDHCLLITLQHQSTPERTRLLKCVCDVMTDRKIVYPGSDLKMVFSVANHASV